MTYECGQCGRAHEELPRFFMWKEPETASGDVIDTTSDHKSLRRTDTQFFVRCELVVPITDGAVELGLICWAEIGREDYESILGFWKSDSTVSALPAWVSGSLAASLTMIPDSFGTRVEFEVLKKDPTPYVKSVAPGRSLASLTKGASSEFWHDFVTAFRGHR